jgi:hypothetical protein
VMLFGFARVGAVVKLRVRDFEHPGTPQAAFRLSMRRAASFNECRHTTVPPRPWRPTVPEPAL